MVFGEQREILEKVDGGRELVKYRVFDKAGTVSLFVAGWVIFILGLFLG